MPQVLFVCTANRYRSVIAAAQFKDELIKRKQENGWKVLSAGTWTSDGMPAMAEAIQNAKKVGLDIREHRSKAITRDLLEQADLILAMESGQKEALRIEFPSYQEKILLLSEAANGTLYDIPDPVTKPSDVDVVKEICSLVQAGFDRICALAVR